MRTLRLVAAVLGCMLSGWPLSTSGTAQGQRHPREFVAREFIVKYRPGSLEGERARARGRANGQLKRQQRVGDGAYLDVVEIPAGKDLDTAIRDAAADPVVEYAERNWVYQHFATPNDPYFSQLWGLHNTGQSVAGWTGRADSDIDAQEAWDRATGSPRVYVAVIDQGVDFLHPDLGIEPGGTIWTNPYDPVDGIDNDGNGYVDDQHGFDFVANDATVYDGSPSDPSIDFHGTHVSGTIGARANNAAGIVGVSWDVGIITAKFLTAAGGTTDAAVRAVDYVVDLKTRHGLNIVAINASWGGGGYSQALLEAIARAARENILFITAAGNGGPDQVGDNNDVFPTYPANYDTAALAGYDSVVAVAATGLSDELSTFSNFGDRTVDIGAPGFYILSTTPQGRYDYSNGTSMATPHVTGAAAVVAAATGLRGSGLRARLLATVDPIAGLNGRVSTDGRLNLSSALSASPPPLEPPTTLPAPWTSHDIGAVGADGSASAMSGTFTLTGAGADVWNTADAFRYAYQPMTGDGSIVAHVATMQPVHAWTKAGVMIRAGLSPSAAHAFMLVSAGKGVAFQRRPSDGAISVHTAGTFTTAPHWVKLTRTGTTITAFESADGASWTVVGTSTIALGEVAYVGLALSSHVAGALAQAGFDNVSVTVAAPPPPPPPPPAPTWANRDIGAVGGAGSANESGGTFTVTGSGTDIWGTSDQFHYVYQPLTGDAIIVARVATVQDTHVWVKAGVMIRETLDAQSAHAFMIVTPGVTKGLAFQRRVTSGDISTHTPAGSGTPPAWVKLVRSGSTISAYRSDDGVAWTFVGADTFTMGASVYVGLAVSSHDNAVLATATFDNVTITR